ncbi:MAG: hypothetical protein NUV93_00790, partial [Firmicutes bacterium]|nr:hypothetical protein [Bacillota bacterium]
MGNMTGHSLRACLALLVAAMLIASCGGRPGPATQPARETIGGTGDVRGEAGGDAGGDAGGEADDDAGGEPAEVRAAERALVFSEEDLRMGLDAKVRYSEQELALIAEADEMCGKGEFARADSLYREIAGKNSAWQRDPLLLINWGRAQTGIGLLLEAHAKLELAFEKMGAVPHLRGPFVSAAKGLLQRMPNTEEYFHRRRPLLGMVHEMDPADPEAGLAYVEMSLSDLQPGVGAESAGGELRSYREALDAVARLDLTDEQRSRLFRAYSCLLSVYLSAYDASSFVPDIRYCLERALQARGTPPSEDDAYLSYVRGLLSEYDGDVETASAHMRRAKAADPASPPVMLWLAAREAAVTGTVPGKPTRTVSPGDVAPDIVGLGAADAIA